MRIRVGYCLRGTATMFIYEIIMLIFEVIKKIIVAFGVAIMTMLLSWAYGEKQAPVILPMDDAYICEVGVEGFVFPEKEFAASEDYSYTNRYYDCTYSDFSDYLDDVIDYMSDSGKAFYFKDSSYDIKDEEGTTHYLFTANSPDDYFISEDKNEFKIYYSHNEKIYVITGFFFGDVIQVRIEQVPSDELFEVYSK